MNDIVLPGGRRGRLVPGDDAGEWRLVLTDDEELAHILKAAGASDDAITIADRLAAAWHRSGMDTRSRSCGGGSGSGVPLDERIHEPSRRTVSSILRAAAPYHHAVIAVVLYEDRTQQRVSQAALGLTRVVKAIGVI